MYHGIQVSPKALWQAELRRGVSSSRVPGAVYGLSLTAELAQESEREDELCVFIDDIVKGGSAESNGESNTV